MEQELYLAPCFLIEGSDFHKAWFEAVYAVTNMGVSLLFGSPKEPKRARDSCQTIVLTGNVPLTKS